MVERIKQAIEKARLAREDGASATSAPQGRRPSRRAADDLWQELTQIEPDAAVMQRSRIVTSQKSDPAHIAFDVLRTRLLSTCRDNGWSRIGITSPSPGVGKTVISANLAFSLARRQDCRTVLLDLDLRAPRLASSLGVYDAPQIAWFLEGGTPPERYLNRIGNNLAVGLNAVRVRDSAELMQSAQTHASLAAMRAALAPDIILHDLPPLLVHDDAIGFLPNLDCVILVVAAGETTADSIAECELLLSERTHFLGVVLNKGTPTSQDLQAYGYGT
ncbi:MAG: CpsD/CapB family tyrosine-protein kinase [Pseudomonadota bacterium]